MVKNLGASVTRLATESCAIRKHNSPAGMYESCLLHLGYRDRCRSQRPVEPQDSSGITNPILEILETTYLQHWTVLYPSLVLYHVWAPFLSFVDSASTRGFTSVCIHCFRSQSLDCFPYPSHCLVMVHRHHESEHLIVLRRMVELDLDTSVR